MTKLLLILLFTTLFLLSPSHANAEGISIGVSPPIIQIVADPPANIQTPITLQNLKDQSATFEIVLKPFIPSDKENGQGVYVGNSKGIPGPDQKLFEKVQILENGDKIDTIVLGPKQQKTFTLHISIPDDEPLSDYYFSVVFISKPDQNDKAKNFSSATAGVATNVLLSIGKEDAKGSIKEFSAPAFLEKGPVPFTVRVANSGKHVIAPSGSIIIHNMFQQAIGEVKLLPVNILAKSTRAIPDSPQNQVALWQEKFLLGFYSATLTVSLSNNGPVYIKSTNFTAFPVSILLAFLIICFILLLIRKRLKSRLAQLLIILLFSLFLFPKNVSAVTTSSVQTQASVAETITLTLNGLPSTTAINTGNSVGCTNTELTSPGGTTTSTAINLGQLSNDISIAAQLITVTTNSTSGYSLLASTNGFFRNNENNFQIGSSATPKSFPLSGHFFGIHACGHDLSISTWGTGKTIRGSSALYAWPIVGTQLLIASDSTGPISTTVTPGNGVTTIEYAASIDDTVPSGTYTGVITFTVSPTF